MEVESDEHDGTAVDMPFIVKDGSTGYTLAALKKHGGSKTRLVIITAFVSFIIVSLAFTAGLLVGYLAFGMTKVASTSSQKDSICADPPVLLISLDGFRTEYLDRGLTPNIKSLADNGVRAEYMKPSFPSKTFPNHYTIVTGLYPEQHGIVDNYFYDRTFDEIFSISSPTALDPKWWQGEPVWVTAHNAVLKTAVYFWPGSEVPIKGILPDIYFKYNGSVPYQERIDTVLGWFDHPERTRPQFMASYFEEPDHSGHQAGPDSELVNTALKRVDGVIASYISGLKDRDIFDCVNMVLVSDHGMTATYENRIILLVPDLIPEEYYDQIQFFSYGIFCNIFINESDPELIEEIYNLLRKNLLEANAPADVYLREEAPLEYNIGMDNIQRFGDIFLIARLGAYIKVKSDVPSYVNIGQHGYNNSEPDMTTIFIAHGPSFKSGSIMKPFQNIEIYNLLCELLDIRPSMNNGTSDSLKDAFIKKNMLH